MTFANLLPNDLAAEAGRMKIIMPTVTDGHHIEAVVENQIAAQYLNNVVPQLTAHLRRTLRNDYITVAFPVDDTKVVHHAYSPREILNAMIAHNTAFAHLVKTLDLQPS